MSAPVDAVVNTPMVRDVTPKEREMAIFVIGLHAAFNLRGFPSSYPRRVFFRALDTALAIAGKVGKTDRVGEMDYPQLRTLENVAKNFGFDQVRSC